MTKKMILNILEKNKSSFISGQEVADQLGISRNAVWKHIKSLQNDGFVIDSSKGGYKLSQNSYELLDFMIKKYIKGNFNVEVFDRLESTNSFAIANIHKYDNAVIIAREQTKGRGRLDKSFESPKDNGIYMSIVISNKLETKKIALLTALASVAVSQSILHITKKQPEIKWVNDLFLDGKKICGILTEGITSFENNSISHVVVGIGINLYEHLPSDIRNIAGHIADEKLDKNRLVATIIDNFDKLYQQFVLGDDSFMDYYKSHSLILNKKVAITDRKNKSTFDGVVSDILKDGSIEVIIDGKREIFDGGQVSVKLI